MLIFIKRNIPQELKISTYETCTLKPQSTLKKMKTLKTQHFADSRCCYSTIMKEMFFE